MAAGLQVWDASGNLLIDTTTWCGQILGNFTLAAPHSAGSLSDGNLTLGRPFAFLLPNDGNNGSKAAGNPQGQTVTISGSTLSWSASDQACQVIYGVY